MSKGTFISKFEAEIIRIGVDRGITAPKIAAYLGRDRVTIWKHIKKMEANGTLGNVPFDFVADEIAGAIRAKKS